MPVLLEFANVFKSYPGPGHTPPVEVLRGVTWRVERGQSVAIVGPSGSGKTTLLQLAGGLDVPTSGEVRILGESWAAFSPDERARRRRKLVGFVFQQHWLFPQLTALENVLLPALADRSGPLPVERAKGLLQRVGLADRWDHRPPELSGGECQRVAVVRALILKPQLVLADEPTGSLDARSAEQVADCLVSLHQEEGVSLVVVTHSPALASRMKVRYRLADGLLSPDVLP